MSRLFRSLNNIAELDSHQDKEFANFSVYVLDVLPFSEGCKYDLYVGSTWKEIEDRRK